MAGTVLLVDDDPLVLWLTAEMLEDLGCHVVTAENGWAALDLLRGTGGRAWTATNWRGKLLVFGAI
jgi:CheY-like chemotaxis protein